MTTLNSESLLNSELTTVMEDELSAFSSSTPTFVPMDPETSPVDAFVSLLCDDADERHRRIPLAIQNTTSSTGDSLTGECGN